jgi:hypothetical protein
LRVNDLAVHGVSTDAHLTPRRRKHNGRDDESERPDHHEDETDGGETKTVPWWVTAQYIIARAATAMALSTILGRPISNPFCSPDRLSGGRRQIATASGSDSKNEEPL